MAKSTGGQSSGGKGSTGQGAGKPSTTGNKPAAGRDTSPPKGKKK